MKKLLTIAAIFSVMIGAFTACHHITGSGNIITEKRTVGEFKGVNVGGAFEVEIKNGSTISVEVESDDNILPHIKTEVSGGVLEIRAKDGTNFNDGHYKVFITAPVINSVNASGAAEVEAKDVLKYDGKIDLKASGAAKINAEVDAPDVAAEASGAATIELTGRTKNYDAESSGSGSINSFELRSENTVVKASGAGSAHVHASVGLKANASGAGNISYKGGGNVEQKTSGAGSIKKED